jgi:hypothetical protein
VSAKNAPRQTSPRKKTGKHLFRFAVEYFRIVELRGEIAEDGDECERTHDEA